MERYTPMGILVIINGLGRKEKELHDAMISMHNRQKTDHPRYSNMTDEEFKSYKIENMRYFHNKRREIREEIKKWWKYKEEHKL